MIKHPKYPNGNIYLSGGMQFAKDLGAGWRKEVAQWLKDLGYFPIDIGALDEAYSSEHGHFLRDINGCEPLQRKSNIRKHFIETDLQLVVNDSDALIVYYDGSARRGAGTVSECMVAYQHDIPIFLVSAWEDWESEVSGWLQALTTKIFTTFYDLHEYLKELPPGVIKRDVYGNHHAGDHYLCSLSGEVFKKNKMHYVSKVSPLYSKKSVEVVKQTYEGHVDRYQFILQLLEDEATQELLEGEIQE